MSENKQNYIHEDWLCKRKKMHIIKWIINKKKGKKETE